MLDKEQKEQMSLRYKQDLENQRLRYENEIEEINAEICIDMMYSKYISNFGMKKYKY